ncbi:Helicase associated domain protein [Arthrobacter sp.]|uniref:helicase associated domain-containing protein n=1 Tax=Arthrobacter sp. TaxID=1667 RepID=UPI0033924926
MNVGGTFHRGESRHPEWDLMYRKGLTSSRIADLCGAVGETVARHIRIQRARHPCMEAEHRGHLPSKKLRPLLRSWQSKIDALGSIRASEGAYPTSRDPDAERRRLATWLSVQRRLNRDGRLTAVQKDALQKLPGWENDQRKELERQRWRARVVDLRAFKAERGKWPRFRRPVDETERVLGVWLHAQRQKFGAGLLTKDEIRLLNSNAPGWNSWRMNRSAGTSAGGDARPARQARASGPQDHCL